MVYQLANIMSDVRVCLDRNRTNVSLLVPEADEETLTLDELIRSKIVEGVERVHMDAPYWRLDTGRSFRYDLNGLDDDNNGVVDDELRSIYWKVDSGGQTDTCGWLLLPDDFMRLIVFKMSDWERPVYTPISALDPEYSKQNSRFHGIRGTAERPVVAVTMHPTGKMLEFWSCKNTSATVTQADYIPYPVIETNGNVEAIDICQRCYEGVVYTVAGLTLTSCGEADKAAQMFNMAKTIIEK